MPNTKVTKQKWKDHLSYSKKTYIIGMLIAIGIASLIYSVTRYVPADEYAVTIQLVDSYVDVAKLDEDLPTLLAKGQEFDQELEDVSFLTIAYSGDPSKDYEGSQVYAVQVSVGGNDIFVQNMQLTQGLIDQSYCVMLETLEGFEAFNRKYPEAVLWLEEPAPDGKEEDEAYIREKHAYAIDVSSLLGFNERRAIDITGKYAILSVGSKNKETSFHVLTDFFDVFAPKGAK